MQRPLHSGLASAVSQPLIEPSDRRREQVSVTAQTFRNLLYREPRLYDLIFPDADHSIARMVWAAIDRWASVVPRSILDVGCGTGQAPRDARQGYPGVPRR
jgi:SAM-dependent methyltransferase